MNPHPPSPSSLRSNVPDAIGRVRRDLRGLGALEVMLVVVGVGGLLAVDIRAFVIARNLEIELTIAAVVLLSLTYLVLALRIRAGRALLLRELHVMEDRHGRVTTTMIDHPYRSPGIAPRSSEMMVARRFRLVGDRRDGQHLPVLLDVASHRASEQRAAERAQDRNAMTAFVPGVDER